MRITPKAATRSCAICERRMLTGEVPVRFAPDRSEGFVDVCPLCQEIALESGWLKEGKLKYREDVVEGLENAPKAFLGLFRGENFGKLIVRVGDDPTRAKG